MPPYLRALTAQEEIYWRLTYNDQIHFVLAAEVRGRTQIEQSRAALDSVQRRHPLLQIAIEMPGLGNNHRLPVFIPKQSEIIPLRTTELRGDEGELAAEIQRELATPFLSGVAPLARAVLLRAPQRSVFLIALSHSIADGISGLFLLRDLLTFLSGHSLQVLPMPPTAEELLGVAPAVPRSTPSGENTPSRNAGRKLSVLLRSMPTHITKSLLGTARAHGSTLHGALAAAFVLAMRKSAPRFELEPVRIISPVNTRAELGVSDALGMYFTSPQCSFDPKEVKTFWELAAQARAAIEESSSRQALLETTSAMQSLIKQGLNNESAASILKTGFAMDLLLSNLGRIPFNQEFGNISLERVWGPAVLAGLDESQAIGVVTTGDQLCFTLASRDPMPDLLETAINILSDQIALS